MARAKRYDEYNPELQFGSGEYNPDTCVVASPVELFPANFKEPSLRVQEVARETIAPPVLRLLPNIKNAPVAVSALPYRLLLLEGVVMCERAAIHLQESDNSELQPVLTRMNALVALLAKRWRRRGSLPVISMDGPTLELR